MPASTCSQPPAREDAVPATASNGKRAGEDLAGPAKLQKLKCIAAVVPMPGPEPAPAVKPKRTRRTREQIEADKLAKDEEKERKKAEKEEAKTKAVNHLAALHQPVDILNKTPRPSMQAFTLHKACRNSQSGSMFVVEDETPMVPQGFKRVNTYSDHEDVHNPTPFKRAKSTKGVPTAPSFDVEIVAQEIEEDKGAEEPKDRVSNDGDSSKLDLHDTSMLNDEERAKALAIIEKKVKEIEVKGKGKGSVSKAEKDEQKAEQAAARAAAKAAAKADKAAAKAAAKADKAAAKVAAKADKAAVKAMEKSEKAATKAKVREEKEKSKQDAKEGKVAVDAAGEPACEAIPKAKRQKKDKATSGD